MTTEKLSENLGMKPEEANELFGEETLSSMQTLANGEKAPSSVHSSPHSRPGCGVVNHGCHVPFTDCGIPQSNCTYYACRNNECVNNGDTCHQHQYACSDNNCTHNGCPTFPDPPPTPYPTPYPTPRP